MGEIPLPELARLAAEPSGAGGTASEIGMEERRPLPAYLAIALFALVMAALLTPGLNLGL